jgi:cytochrome d ubiquinol oxidase subunit II
MDPTALQLLWFALLGVLLAGYGILDGFDLGVGILHLFVRQDRDRRLLMNSIGPLWDGNEVWLVVFGGALFAAFPRAYAAAFSGLYTPLMLILFALIFRGVSMEFRSKREMPWWRTFWDVAFSLASVLATFLFGVAVGNFMVGLPIGADGDFEQSVPLTTLLRPYPVLTGLFAVATFAMHGAIFLYMKTEDDLQRRVRRWMWVTFFLFLAMYLAVSAYTLTTIARSTAKYADYPWAWLVPILNVLAIANIPRAIYQGRPLDAFISSSCTIAAFTFLFGLTLFPNMIVSSVKPEYSLTVASASSTEGTLGLMAVIAVLGMPFVLSYTAVVYWVFRGKTQLGKFSY